jgi:hypothetical protein
MTRDADENMAIVTSADGSVKRVPVTEISNIQKSAGNALATRRGLTARRGVAGSKGTEVGFHDPEAGFVYTDYEIMQDPKALRQQKGLPGAKPLPSGAPAGFIAPPSPPAMLNSPNTPKLLQAPPAPPKGPNPQSFWNPAPFSAVPPKSPYVSLFGAMSAGIGRLVIALMKFREEIEKTSRILSTDWTDAAKILVERVGYSISSGIKALMGKGTFARYDEIQQAQEQFGQQFGGVMSTEKATEMAGIARQLNVMPQQYIAALRPLSGILGGVGQAQAKIQATTKAFMAAGLTGKDAAQFMAENSNIIARNGSRFADSLTRAAVEAKKAGYNLQSIEGFGDRIVGDFEGFLEDATAMAAMGMQFDVSSLAEAAVSGDTERLKNELQSQLQAQGLSLENMNRAQRMQLEKTIGMPLEEALKIQKAPETAESVTAQLDMEAAKMQSQAANLFRTAVAAFEVGVAIFAAAVGARAFTKFLDVLPTRMGGMLSGPLNKIFNPLISGFIQLKNIFVGLPGKLSGPISSIFGKLSTSLSTLFARIASSRAGQFVSRVAGNVAGRVGGLASRVAGSRVGQAIGNVAGRAMQFGRGAMGRVGGLASRFAPSLRALPARAFSGLGLGIAGTGLSMAGDALKARGYEKTGAVADIAGKAASFAGVGMLFGPIGGAVGALVGTIYGLITNWEAVKKMLSAAFDGIATAAKWVGEKITSFAKWFWENNPVFVAFRALASGIMGIIDKIKNFKFTDLFRNDSPVNAAQNNAQQTEENKPGFFSRLFSRNESQVATATSARATATTPVVAAAVTRSTNEMQSDTRAVTNNRNTAPVINLPDNATLQQQVTELIRQVAVSNQKLDALANQTITVNMDGQRVGNIIRRSAMAASTGASTARSNG